MTFWLPLIFAFLFGLSMDYEVFILTRMREEYDRSGSPPRPRCPGIGRTGRLVTSAALILFFAFAALASAPGTDIKVFATASASASSSTRRSCAPCSCPRWSCFGRWNWWLPVWVAKIMRVEPSPLQPASTPKDDEREPVLVS